MKTLLTSKKFIQIIFTFQLFLLPGNSKAQLYFKTKNLNAENGLSDNRVTCFHKDKKGFMWIGYSIVWKPIFGVKVFCFKI